MDTAKLGASDRYILFFALQLFEKAIWKNEINALRAVCCAFTANYGMEVGFTFREVSLAKVSIFIPKFKVVFAFCEQCFGFTPKTVALQPSNMRRVVFPVS